MAYTVFNPNPKGQRVGDCAVRAVAGKRADDAWMVMDELAEAVKVLQPKLYQATIDRLKEQ